MSVVQFDFSEKPCGHEPTFSMHCLVGSGLSLESGYGCLVLWRESDEDESKDVGS